MTYNAGSRKDIRQAEKALAQSLTVNREVIVGLMSIMNGRHWVWDRLEEAGIFTSAFSPDPAIHAYNAGLRVFATKLFSDVMSYAPDQFNLMMREAHVRSTATERSRSTDPDWRDQGTDADPGSESGDSGAPFGTDPEG